MFGDNASRIAVCGRKFHPEKSRKAGLELLKNFVELADG